MNKPRDRHRERTEAARRDLERLDEQSEKLLGGGANRPGDIDHNDPIEIWGRRLGRGAGFIFVVYLIYTLSRYISFGGAGG